MKYIFIFLIIIYQKIMSPLLKNILGTNSFCRFSPSCSEYTRQTVYKDGIIKGSMKSIVRILRCQPFFSF